MKLRAFLSSLFTIPIAACTIPVVGNSPEEVKHRKDISDVKLEDLEKPIEKKLTFMCGPYKVWMEITRNFIIPCGEYYEINVYGDLYKTIGEAILVHKIETKSKRVRFEGPIFRKEDLDKQWNIDSINVMNLLATLKENQMDIITEYPKTKIKLG